MTTLSQPGAASRASRGAVRAPQSLAAGLALLALAALAFWLTADLASGTLRELGPALLPRALAAGVGLCGLALVAAGFVGAGERLDAWGLRGPVFVLAGIAAFALTIRPVEVGGASTPGLGLIVAGPLAVIIGGFATPEARLRELVILAFALTAFCMVLFGDLLNLPIPVFPRALADLLPPEWSQRFILRASAGSLALVAAWLWVLGRPGRSRRA